jgi:hypothetical protein
VSLANTARKQAGGFQKGQSGNPAGRPAGSRNSATLACEALLEGQAEALTQKAVEMALSGDTVALKLCLERIYPARKDRPVTFPLPPINTARDAADIMSAVMGAVAAGQVTPADAAEISKVVACAVKAFEVAGFAESTLTVRQLSDAELMRIAMGDDPTLVIAARNQRQLLASRSS